MTTSQKAALSLLIAVLLFGAFAALTFTSLFDLIEARFYNPSITASIIRENTRNGEEVDNFFEEMRGRFAETLKNPAIRRSFLPNQSFEDIFERSRIYGLLIESISGFQWVRFIDSGGSRIHFSSYGPDVMRHDNTAVAYANYNETGFPYESIASGNYEEPRLIFDERGDRILFSFPFYDSFDVYLGTALFSLSSNAVSDRLIRERRIKVGQDISVIANPQGLLFGMSAAGETAMPSQVSAVWKEGWQRTTRLVSPNSGLSLALISVKTSQGLFYGRLVNEELFTFPMTMKIILLASFFFTVYLTIFLFLNLRQDSVTIVQNRLKQLQISLIEQFYERKSDMDWARWSRELEQRRDEINARVKQGIKTASGSTAGDIDVLIDKSWDELLSVMGGRSQLASNDAGIDEEKLQTILNRILAALPGTAASGLSAQPSAAPVTQAPAMETSPLPAGEDDSVEELEEVEEVEEADEAAEAAEAAEEPPEAEEPEELEELEELEALEEAGSDEITAESVAESASVPTAEVPEIDVEEMNLSVAAADEVLQAIVSGDEVEELEELEELEETEEAESPKDEAASAKRPGSEMFRLDPASEIEFSTENEPEINIDVSIGDDLEIVSPFSSMLYDFSDSVEGEEEPDEEIPETPPVSPETELSSSVEDEEDEKKNEPNNIINLTQERSLSVQSLPYEHFLGMTGDKNIEVLEAFPENDEHIIEDAGIIEEREGIPYITEDVLSPDSKTDASLNRDFKKLVDSVVKP